jgi:carbonic anhydrase
LLHFSAVQTPEFRSNWFSQGFGGLFVTRIAGNLESSEIIGSLEFGIRILRAKVLCFPGHPEYRAVAATVGKAEQTGDRFGPSNINGPLQHACSSPSL